mgnify:CR=1 FL=1
MNDSRLKVYEQLEVSMVELERTNKRLGEEGLGDKERIRDLGDTVRSLEIKCEELQRLLDEVILRARPGPGDTGHSLRPDVTCQVRLERKITRSERSNKFAFMYAFLLLSVDYVKLRAQVEKPSCGPSCGPK